jgi:hypothetical protein
MWLLNRMSNIIKISHKTLGQLASSYYAKDNPLRAALRFTFMM